MSLDPAAGHRRKVRLDLVAESIEIEDVVTTTGRHAIRSAMHLGPEVACRLEGKTASLSWNAETEGEEWSATIRLDPGLSWSVHRGETTPVLGWYSSSFGAVEPTSVLMGEGNCEPGSTHLRTAITFSPRPERSGEGQGNVAR
jgi:hypothetical protein